MSTLVTLATLLVALVAFAEATTYTTITTTTIDGDEAAANPRGRGASQCRTMEMSHCRMYLQSRQGSPYESLRMVVNPRMGGEQHLEQCCEQLRNIETPECRCQAIKMMMQQQETEQMQEMMRKAKQLPQRCKVEVSQQCSSQPMWF